MLTYCLLHILTFGVYSQVSNNAPSDSIALPDSGTIAKPAFVANPALDLSFGPVYGMHPNLKNIYPKGYYFVEGKGSAVVMGLPFKLAFRKSDEDLRFGRASYFKLSYDAAAYSKQNISALTKQLGGLEALIGEKQKFLYGLEAKLSYLYQKKTEYQNKLKLQSLEIPSAPSLNVPDLNNPQGKLPDSLGANLPEIPNFQTPDLNTDQLKLDSVQLKLENLTQSLHIAQQQLDELKNKQLDLKADYSKAIGKLPLDFLSGIKKMDFGLTSLGKSSMSRNAMPIQGVHVQYAGEHYFTDVAAGYTLPNQLFSNQAFDQILYNSGNIFNIGNFFQVSSVKFVSSAKVGYGKETGNHVAIENYYSGTALKKTGNDNAARGLTTNLTSRYTSSKWKNLTWQNTIGVTWTTPPDSLGTAAPIKTADRISLYSSATVNFPKLQSSLESSYRRIPSAYDGWTQGIYLRQTERIEVNYKQVLTKRLRTAIHISRDLFYLQNALSSSRLIHQVGLDMQIKLSHHLVMTGNYSLLQLQERAVAGSPRSDISHMARLGAVSTHEIKKNEFTTVHDVSYAQINGFDSTQTLLQANAKYAFQLKRWRFGLQLQASDFTGLTRLYGRNAMVQPEIGLKLENLYFAAAFQQLWSDQFERDYGMQFKAGFAFSEYVDFDFMMQRFLPTEYALFIDPALEYQKPFYVKFGLNVHL